MPQAFEMELSPPLLFNFNGLRKVLGEMTKLKSNASHDGPKHIYNNRIKS